MTEHDEKNAAPEEEIAADVDFESEEDLGDLGAAHAKLKKLRLELKDAQKKRDEYLDGWQRCKADSVNLRHEAARSAARSAELLREALIHDIIPVLDSFDMATGNEAWAQVNDGFRSGMEHVRNQLIQALEAHDVKRFGAVGEMFDPRLHEVVQEMADVAGEQHSVVKILRYGYKTGDRILRPAQVVIKS